MEQKPKIFIGFRSFIPDEWIKESYEFLSEHNGQIKYEKEQPGAFNHYEPQWLDAVVVFATVMMNEIFRDALKSFIKSLLRKLQSKAVKLIRAGGSTTDINPGISFQYSDGKGKVLKIRFGSEVAPEVIERMVDSGMSLINAEKTDEFFGNSDYADQVKDSTILNMEYNEANDKWEPINFKKRHDDLMNKLRQADS
ncbi:MAG: hypothetical protein DRI97_18710 [Bacteroidetes bacterium]|nr:MAG: hypothetical protein DRI97_18710 [Bacteroidota bacterium]